MLCIGRDSQLLVMDSCFSVKSDLPARRITSTFLLRMPHWPHAKATLSCMQRELQSIPPCFHTLGKWDLSAWPQVLQTCCCHASASAQPNLSPQHASWLSSQCAASVKPNCDLAQPCASLTGRASHSMNCTHGCAYKDSSVSLLDSVKCV